jgi:serpin B
MDGKISKKLKVSPQQPPSRGLGIPPEFFKSRPLPVRPSESLNKSIENQTEVALEITKHLLSNPKFSDKNIVFSPLSIHVILSIITAGTRGEIQNQKLKFLKSNSIEEVNSLAEKVYPLVFADGSQRGGPKLSFVNGAWIEQSLPINPNFQNVVENVYKAAVKQVDFKNEPEKARTDVNSWGEKQTNGLIKDILPPNSVDELTRLVLANALYFKGEWTQPFNESKTNVQKFELLNKAGSVEAPFMTKRKRSEFVKEFETFKVLRLPYKQGDDYEREYSMYIFLPNQTNGLPDLINNFCSDSKIIKKHIPRGTVDVGKFLIPKFKISFDFKALEYLESLGFSGKGLTKMVDPDTGELEVSEIFHKAFIQVNEKGTEAAAITGAILAGCSAFKPPPPIDFVADHPFLYLIREEVTETVIFVGQVLNPIQE